DRARDGVTAEFLARVDVRDVDFNRGQTGTGDRVAQGYAGVRESGAVQDDAGGARFAESGDVIDQRPLVIGLEERDVDTERLRLVAQALLEVRQRGMTIDFRLTTTESVEIRPVDDGNGFHAVACARRRVKLERVVRGNELPRKPETRRKLLGERADPEHFRGIVAAQVKVQPFFLRAVEEVFLHLAGDERIHAGGGQLAADAGSAAGEDRNGAGCFG